jgi:D-3-phosphoglycerate dehydrogenase
MTTGFRVVVSDQVFPALTIERRLIKDAGGELLVADGTPDGVVETAPDAVALLNTYMPVDESLLDRLPQCRVVARYGIGVDNVDIDAANRRGIIVTNVPDYCLEEVATHTLALLLALNRRVIESHSLVLGGGWGVNTLTPMTRLSTLTLGLVGYGQIARRVARSAGTMGLRLLVHDPHLTQPVEEAETVSLPRLLADSDAISIHCPLTPETRGLIDTAALRTMKPGALLINTSRGAVVDGPSVAEALRTGQLGGAALDVFETEPVDLTLWNDVPNVVMTPHVGYYSEQAIAESQTKAVTQVLKALRGDPVDYACGAVGSGPQSKETGR